MKFDLGTQFIEGEFKIELYDKDGNLKQTVDWQKNLFLENGLRMLWQHQAMTINGAVATTFGNYIMDRLAIGTGNSDPEINQTTLDNKIDFVSVGNTIVSSEDPDVGLHEGYIKNSVLGEFTFNNFTSNQNITEIGLLNYSQNASTMILCTRALIRDTSNVPMAITVLQGEILRVYYRINIYVDIRRKTGEFTLTTIDSGGSSSTSQFEYFIQPYSVKTGRLDGRLRKTEIKTLQTYGVLEEDSVLTADYNLADSIYNSITYKDISPINQKVELNSGGSAVIYQSTSNKPSTTDAQHGRYENIEDNYTTKRWTVRYTSGINAHIHTNGIRAFIFNGSRIAYPAANYGDDVAKFLVVLKNKTNGQGIKKTNVYEWTIEYTFTLDRWSGG